jgi:hypothetical protein
MSRSKNTMKPDEQAAMAGMISAVRDPSPRGLVQLGRYQERPRSAVSSASIFRASYFKHLNQPVTGGTGVEDMDELPGQFSEALRRRSLWNQTKRWHRISCSDGRCRVGLVGRIRMFAALSVVVS